MLRAGQAGLLHKCFTDSSSQEGQKSGCGCPCLTARFVRTVFWRQLWANLPGVWYTVALGGGKKNVFSWDQRQIYPLPPLLWKTAASPSAPLGRSAHSPMPGSTGWGNLTQVKYAPKTRTGPCWRSEQQQNPEFVGCCMVLKNIHKEKNKPDLLNIMPASKYFLSPKIYCVWNSAYRQPIHLSSTNVLDTPWGCGIFFSIHVGTNTKVHSLRNSGLNCIVTALFRDPFSPFYCNFVLIAMVSKCLWE